MPKQKFKVGDRFTCNLFRRTIILEKFCEDFNNLTTTSIFHLKHEVDKGYCQITISATYPSVTYSSESNDPLPKHLNKWIRNYITANVIYKLATFQDLKAGAKASATAPKDPIPVVVRTSNGQMHRIVGIEPMDNNTLCFHTVDAADYNYSDNGGTAF
jgi:hypothetical protein